LAGASGVRVVVDLAAIPLSRAAEALGGDRMAAATAGDDYELLFAAPPDAADRVAALGRRLRLRLTPVGRVAAGAGLALLDAAGRDVTPARLGFEHRAAD
jgi:thiamine-monophosphate kinase